MLNIISLLTSFIAGYVDVIHARGQLCTGLSQIDRPELSTLIIQICIHTVAVQLINNKTIETFIFIIIIFLYSFILNKIINLSYVVRNKEFLIIARNSHTVP